MNTSEKLIQLYRNRIETPSYEIFCETSSTKSQFKYFSSDKILFDAFGELSDQAYRNFRNYYRLKIFYSVFDKKERIDLCYKSFHAYIPIKTKYAARKEKKSFLGIIPYTKRWTEEVITRESKEKIQEFKDQGYKGHKHRDDSYYLQKDFYFICYEDLIYEISSDLYEELKMFTIEALKQRSIGKLANAK